MDVMSANAALQSKGVRGVDFGVKPNVGHTPKKGQEIAVSSNPQDSAPVKAFIGNEEGQAGLLPYENSPAKKAEDLQETDVQEVLNAMNEFMDDINTNIHFSLHKETERLMMKVVDRSNGEVLKEIPTEEMLDLMARIQDRVGVLLDKKI